MLPGHRYITARRWCGIRVFPNITGSCVHPQGKCTSPSQRGRTHAEACRPIPVYLGIFRSLGIYYPSISFLPLFPSSFPYLDNLRNGSEQNPPTSRSCQMSAHYMSQTPSQQNLAYLGTTPPRHLMFSHHCFFLGRAISPAITPPPEGWRARRRLRSRSRWPGRLPGAGERHRQAPPAP